MGLLSDPAKTAAPDLFAGARLTIDLDAIAANYGLIAQQAAPAAAGAVVKADAYGMGATRVAPTLAAAGCRDFFVAVLGEALDLKPALPQQARIYVLNGLPRGAEEMFVQAGLRPVLNSLSQVRRWAERARELGRPLPAAVQFDTGMSRLGLSPDEVEALCAEPESLAGIEVALVMSHLACADTPLAQANIDQLALFDRLANRLAPDAPRSLANSAASLGLPASHGDLVRPGIALYGGEPFAGRRSGLFDIVRLDARIIQVREIPDGAGVGYDLTYVAKGRRRIATIGMGYADGWPRRIGDRAAAYFQGARLPVVGRVSMDSMALDVTSLGPGALEEGDLVELIGPNQSLEAVAELAGTVSYEILTDLGGRFERRYLASNSVEGRGA